MRPRCEAVSCVSLVGRVGVGCTILPGWPSGAEVGATVGVEFVLVVDVESVALADFGFCAHGGRSGLSWLNAMPANSTAAMARIKLGWVRKGVIDIGS